MECFFWKFFLVFFPFWRSCCCFYSAKLASQAKRTIHPTNQPTEETEENSGFTTLWCLVCLADVIVVVFIFVCLFCFFCSFAVIVMSPVVSRELRTCFFLLPTFVPFLALNEKQESHNKVNGNNKRPENSKLYVISLNLRLPLCWGSLSLCPCFTYLLLVSSGCVGKLKT